MQYFSGKHLVLDVQTTGPDTINTMEGTYAFLETLTELLNKTLLFPPTVIRYPYATSETTRLSKLLMEAGNQQGANLLTELTERHKDVGGIIGTSIWAESYCATHSYTEQNYISIDLLSSTDFDTNLVIKHITQCFDTQQICGLSITRSRINPPTVHRLTCNGNGTITTQI